MKSQIIQGLDNTYLYAIIAAIVCLCCCSSSCGAYFGLSSGTTPPTPGPSGPSGPSGSSWQEHPQSWMNAQGGDLKGMAGSVDECKAACLADPACKSFCHKTGGNYCWLRDGKASAPRADPLYSCSIKQ